MRNHFFLALFAALFLFQSCSKKNINSTEEDLLALTAPFVAINDLLDNWHKAAAEANGEQYFGALHEDSYFIGTDATEVWSKQEFYDFAKEYFDAGKAWDFTAKSRNVHFSEDGNYVWFDELLDTWMGECRGSGILEFDKKEDTFKIKHYVLSLAVPNEKIYDVIGVIGLVEPREN